jgi:hypothetical protein
MVATSKAGIPEQEGDFASIDNLAPGWMLGRNTMRSVQELETYMYRKRDDNWRRGDLQALDTSGMQCT